MLENCLWAKSVPYKSLKAHMIDAAVCIQEYISAPSSKAIRGFLCQEWGCDEACVEGQLAYLAAMHDIGKAHPDFQRKDERCLERWKEHGYAAWFSGKIELRFRHEKYGEKVLARIWKNRKYDNRLIKCYAAVIGLHHQGYSESDPRDPRSEEWLAVQDKLEAEMRERFIPKIELRAPKHWDAVCMMLTGLIVLCDWVSSSDAYADLAMKDEYEKVSRQTAQKTLVEYGLVSDEMFPRIEKFTDMWTSIREMRPLQRLCEALDANTSLTMIEAPMGEGKTEAALFLAARLCSAYGKRGVYMALPTQATSNQMVERVSDMLETIGAEKARLLHGMAWLSDFQDNQQNDDAAQWLRPLRLALLGGDAVGTVDQAMAAVLRIKFSMLRLLGLANKVLIIDEIHAYDRYMEQIITRMLEWCHALKIPVILLSATMQSTQRKGYLKCFGKEVTVLSESYPLITQVDCHGKLHEYATESVFRTTYAFATIPLLGEAELLADYAMKRVREGGCLCVMLNTVNQAQVVYRVLKDKGGSEDVKLLLFHARFPVEKRNEIERKCLKWFGKGGEACRPSKAILVCTQVVEQSLDVDFDEMITEIAPIDLLLQRAGRVHRHRFRVRPTGFERPNIRVMVPAPSVSDELEHRYGPSGAVYDPFLLKNTENILNDTTEIRVPEDMRSVIERCYERVSEKTIEAYVRRQTGLVYMKNEADHVVYCRPNPKLFFPTQSHPMFELSEVDDGFVPVAGASTRLGEETIRIAFLSEGLYERAVQINSDSEVAREVIKKSVSLRLKGMTNELLKESDCRAIRMEKGMLKGCCIVQAERRCRIGHYRITVDDELGVSWEEVKS